MLMPLAFYSVQGEAARWLSGAAGGRTPILINIEAGAYTAPLQFIRPTQDGPRFIAEA